MRKFKLKRGMGEGGMTLVEVLAALVILGIVFIGFMMIFPQMTTFNMKTGTKLETMNIARQEIVEIQDSLAFKNTFDEAGIKAIIQGIEPAGERVVKSTSTQNNIITISYTKSKHDYEIDVFTNQDLPKSQAGNSFLNKVHLKVMVAGKFNSETFGYIENIGN